VYGSANSSVVMAAFLRAYTAWLLGDDYLDIRGLQTSRPDIYAPADYTASQALGEQVRASGRSGIVYDSVRHVGGTNVAVHRPRHVTEVTQAAHYDLRIVPVVGRIVVLPAKPEAAP